MEVTKSYEYTNEKGKKSVAKRIYKVKNPNTLKSTENKIKLEKYLNENKESILAIEQKKRSKYLIQKAKEDLGLDISYNGAISYLNKLL